MKRLARSCIITFDIVIAVLFVISFLVTIFDNVSSNQYNIGMQLISLCICMCGIVVIKNNLLIRFKDYIQKNYRSILFFTMIILLIIQSIIIVGISTPIGWDVGTIVNAAIDFESDPEWYQFYFSVYPNNRFIFFLYNFLLHNSNKMSVWILLGYLNIIAIDISIVITFFAVKKMANEVWGYLAVIVSIFVYGVFGWIIVPYSDTLVMPFIVGAWLLSMVEKDSTEQKRKIKFDIFLGIICFVGYLIKPTSMIFWIALILVNAFYAIARKTSFGIGKFLIIVSVFIGLNVGWQIYQKHQQIIEIDFNKSMPMTHFMMMGLNEETNGAFCADDVNYTWQFETTEEKKMGNIKIIQERLQNFGFGDYLSFIAEKFKYIFCEGDFFWGKEGGFASYDFETGNVPLKNYYYPDGKYHVAYLYVTQGAWLLVQLLFIGTIIRDQDENMTLLHCTIFGLILFLLLFEMRSRYLIPFLPLFCSGATIGLSEINNKIYEIKDRIS